MKVTKFGYSIETNLIPKLDLMIARCVQKNPKRDSTLLIEGAEGEGKTTFSIAIAYYVKEKTGRSFGAKNVFFDLEKMIKFLKDSEDQIAIWDEPAFQALSGDSRSMIVKDLTRLLMTARKKRHFIIINMTYFNKFNEYIVAQRPLGMIHVYSRNQLVSGRFIYIKKKNLEYLWNEWIKRRRRNYIKFASKRIRGSFPDVLNPHYKHNVLSEFDVELYEKEKDHAISLIGDKKSEKNKYKTALRIMKKVIGSLRPPIMTKKELAERLGIPPRTFERWKNYEVESTEINVFKKDTPEIAIPQDPLLIS